jgi:hypothetical protein
MSAMKTKHLLLIAFMFSGFLACDNEGTDPEINISLSSVSFSACRAGEKSDDQNLPSIRLSGMPGDNLLVTLKNTEFCCGTDSVSVNCATSGNAINIEIIDQGPFTFCYCPHDLEFIVAPMEQKTYNLTLIESEHSYSRDTFYITFDYSAQLDTTVAGGNTGNMLSDNPVQYAGTEFGGCNLGYKMDSIPKNDTIIFYELTDTMNVFVALNLPCCMEFNSESWTEADTLMMRINTIRDDQCDCICYYTFEYFFADYTGQGFYYKFYKDSYVYFEGSQNLP